MYCFINFTIKFSKFYKNDLPDLVYLEHLAGKYRDKGVSLIFINSLGKHYKEAISKICSFSSPIIEDDGLILGLFNAMQEETILVDRNFTIKFMSNIEYIFNKSLIYNELIKWTFEKSLPYKKTHSEELTLILDQLLFYDLLRKKTCN